VGIGAFINGYSTDMSKARLPLNYWKLWSATAISNVGNGVSAIAFPWLASALTRSPLTIAVVGLMSQLPWLLFTLPAGVITDRFDRKQIIIATDVVRGLVTLVSTAVLFLHRHDFLHIKNPSLGYTGHSATMLIAIMMGATFILGSAEVLGNNSSQTFMPDVVAGEHLHKANGQMWSAESITNSFLGPALGSLLLGASIYLPFLFDAGSFFVSAALIALITTQSAAIMKKKSEGASTSFIFELKEGFNWLMQHKILRPMAYTLGALNFINSMAMASYILYAQEVLKVSVFVFAFMGTSVAISGFLAGIVGPKLIAKIGQGRAMTLALIGFPTLFFLSFTVTRWPIFYLLSFFEMFASVVWNIITVSYRQSVIPSEILGRVNSGYRFFGWGSMPLGSLAGGVIVSISAHFISRPWALRAPFLISGVIGLVIFYLTRRRFTSDSLKAEGEGA
jgi:MFS family permease